MQLAREVMSPGLPLGGGCDALLSGDGSAWEVQRVLGIDQLHFQVVGGNALLTDVVRLLHIGAVLAHTAYSCSHYLN